MKHIEEKLYADLTHLAHTILRLKEKEDISALKKTTRLLYEKIAVLDFVRQQQRMFPENAPIVNDAKKIETKITTEKETVKIPLQKKPLEKKAVVEPLKKAPKPNIFLGKEFENTLPIEKGLKLFQHKNKVINTTQNPQKKLLQKRTPIRIDLNDRIAFVKHLFEDNLTNFINLCEDIRNFHNFEVAKTFINEHFYKKHWSEKSDYTARFFTILENYYAKN